MPLLDHFNPPLSPRHPWQSFCSNWATRLADVLTDRWLPSEFVAAEYVHSDSSPGIDVATREPPPAWAPLAAAHTMPAVFPDTFEVRVFATISGLTLVGAIELISPGNKDRPEERLAFATKCASYLYQGVSLVLIDIVTSRRANLHNQILRLMAADAAWQLPDEVNLYAVAYRPVLRQERPEIDVWPVTCTVGGPLPVLPLRLTGDLFVPVDFESTYQEACRRRRLA
jgi:hypothetical protein